MATINYKEKYEKAVHAAMLAKQDTESAVTIRILEEIFPELNESEDEKIRKWLISTLKSLNSTAVQIDGAYEMMLPAIAWLEKQGEQKPTNNVIEEEKPLLEKFKQAVYDCAWEKVTCKVEGETQEEYAERWAEQLLMLVRDWADDYIDSREDAIRRRSFDKGRYSIQNLAWSEEDESIMNAIYKFLDGSDALSVDQQQAKYWLKSLKDRVQPQLKQEWKQENTHDLTDFENVMMHIGDSFFGQYAGLDQNDTNAIKEQAAILLGLVPKQEWSEEEAKVLNRISAILVDASEVKNWWKEYRLIERDEMIRLTDFLKSIRPQTQWKPSDEQIKALKEACNEHWEPDGLDPLYTLYQNLKKLREE